MQVSIQINNASKNLVKALKAMLKMDEKLDYTFKEQKKPSKELLEAIEELKNGGGTLCKDFEDFKQKVLSWNINLNIQLILKNH